MIQFTSEEINLICLYDPTSRKDAMLALCEMMKDLMPDETDLESLAKSTIAKLESLTDGIKSFRSAGIKMYTRKTSFRINRQE